MLYLIYRISPDQLLLRLINLNIFLLLYIGKKMQVNDHNLIVYPQNLKKYTGYIEEIQSKKIKI